MDFYDILFASNRGGGGSRNLPIHICSSSEYDAETHVPTISSPSTDMFYLVPAPNGTSPDMFIEYIYVNDDWEVFGSVSIDVTQFAKDDEVMKLADYDSETWTFTLEDDTTVTKKVVIEL